MILAHTLSIRSPAIPVVGGIAALVPVRLSGHEGVNGLFHYELLFKTPDALNLGASGAADFDLDASIGRELGCVIELDGAGEIMAGAVGASTDCRIFQNQSVVEIFNALLADYAFPVDKRLIETYPSRDYQTQFNESDFDFFARLCQEWGINYFFEHEGDTHRLVLVDTMGAYQPNPSEAYRVVEYHAPGWKTDAEYLHSFVPANRLTSGQYSTRDYHYTRPRADLSTGRKDPRPTGEAGSHYAQPRAGTGTPDR